MKFLRNVTGMIVWAMGLVFILYALHLTLIYIGGYEAIDGFLVWLSCTWENMWNAPVAAEWKDISIIVLVTVAGLLLISLALRLLRG